MTTEQFRATWCLLEDRRLLSLKPPIEMDPWALVLLVFGKRLLLLDQFEEDFFRNYLCRIRIFNALCVNVHICSDIF